MSALVRLDGVRKRYGRADVLKHVTLSMEPGEFVVLIGGSGSGKTTLLRLVAGLARADGGTIELRGMIVDHARKGRFVPAERRRLGMVFQDYALWPHFTCLQNVEAAARGTTAAKRARARELLRRVGMADFAATRPHQLSGGQQQRVGVARALAAEPDLLLFDEALSSLDVDIRERLRLEIRQLSQETGAAALFVSHDPVDAWRLADRVMVLEDGRLTQDAAPTALYAEPKTARVARFIGAGGGFLSTVEYQNGALGVRLAGHFCPVQASSVPPGTRGLVYVRPEGIRLSKRGVPAELQFCAFEAGRYRAYWRIEGIDGNLSSHEASKPTSTAHLAIAPEHILIYPTDGDIRTS